MLKSITFTQEVLQSKKIFFQLRVYLSPLLSQFIKLLIILEMLELKKKKKCLEKQISLKDLTKEIQKILNRDNLGN